MTKFEDIVYRELYENAPIAYFTVNKEGKITRCNRATVDLLGYKKKEIRSMKLSELYPEDLKDKEKPKSLLNLFLKGKEIKNEERLIRHKDGHKIWVSLSLYLIKDSKGLISEGRVMALDITSQKENQRRLKKQKEIIQELLNATKTILKYQDFNKSAREIFESCKKVTGAKSGYVALLSEDGSENELLFLDSGGLSCTVDSDLPMPIRGLRAKAYKKGEVVYDNSFMDSEFEKFLPEGHVFLKNVLFGPLNIEGKTVGVIGLANKESDFTEQDVEFVSGFSELAAIALYNSRMINELKKSRERFKKAFERTELYKNIFAHDISNIFQNILSATDILKTYAANTKKSEKMKDLISLSQSQIKKGSKLISDLLTFSEIEERGLKLQGIDLCQKLKDAILFVRNIYPKTPISISVDSPFDEIYVTANNLLTEVFENILINAVKYNESEVKRITIKLSSEKVKGNNQIKIEFIDNGIGIPDPLKKRIFSEAIEKEEEHKGLGLGLLLVKRIIEEYGGSIEVENRVESDYKKGSNFIIKIPAYE